MPRGPQPIPPYDRIMRRVVKEPDGCWLVTGALHKTGYADVVIRNGASYSKRLYAHRVVYEQHQGPIPAKHDVHHLCHVRNCVNPDHLAAVHHNEHPKEHIQTECRNCGTDDWYIRPDTGGRMCRECIRRRRKRAAA